MRRVIPIPYPSSGFALSVSKGFDGTSILFLAVVISTVTASDGAVGAGPDYAFRAVACARMQRWQ